MNAKWRLAAGLQLSENCALRANGCVRDRVIEQDDFVANQGIARSALKR
tara:strand:+ start:440 stop:586 length:147 start_codon:yes stop_codon:yes gene_type:complete